MPLLVAALNVGVCRARGPSRPTLISPRLAPAGTYRLRLHARGRNAVGWDSGIDWPGVLAPPPKIDGTDPDVDRFSTLVEPPDRPCASGSRRGPELGSMTGRRVLK
ncbi:hypothetical protein GCM10009727_12450 [Actinomadura napierensis]|uniref:Uncharacterized protein n=1 Tax=Actinomadura napierensis TaxID=267854 RepID=A0ABN2YBS1_9ACTN